MYTCIYVCMYTNINMYIYTCVYIFTYAHAYTSTYNLYIHMYVYFGHNYICICIFIGINWGMTLYFKSSNLVPFLSLYKRICQISFDRVCCFVLLNQYWWIVMYGVGASSWASQGRRTHDPRSPTSQPYPAPPLITWGVRILTLRLNYVAGYTDPLPFLFERTYNYYVDNQGLVPFQFRRLGKSKVRSAS